MPQEQNSNLSKKFVRDIIPKSEQAENLKHVEREEFFKTLTDLKRKEKGVLGVENPPAGGKTPTLEEGERRNDNRPPRYFRIEKGKKTALIFAVFLASVVLGAVFYLLTPASSVVIKITPASKSVLINSFLKAAETGGDISFSLLKFSIEKEGKIKAVSVSRAEKKASGVIMVYNAYGTAPQTLVKNTRFETPEGKIYRIDKNITVPGAKTINKKLVPGSVEAIVYADKPGSEYNAEFSDFTIPGFRGTAKYDKFYARSKTTIQGGFSGNVPKADEKDSKKLSERLKKDIEDETFVKALEKIGEDEFWLKDGVVINFYSEISVSEDPEYALLRQKADIAMPVFKKEEVAAYLAAKYAPNDFKEGVYLKNFDKFLFQTLKKDLTLNKEITFKIEGDAIFGKNIDIEKISSEIASVKNIQEFFRGKPEIESAETVFRPLFKKKLPKNPSKIKIEIKK